MQIYQATSYCKMKEGDEMIRQSKAAVLKAIVVIFLAAFVGGVTGCCPGGPGCDWYSSDNEAQPKKESN